MPRRPPSLLDEARELVRVIMGVFALAGGLWLFRAAVEFLRF